MIRQAGCRTRASLSAWWLSRRDRRWMRDGRCAPGIGPMDACTGMRGQTSDTGERERNARDVKGCDGQRG